MYSLSPTLLLTTEESIPIAGVDFHRLASVVDTTGTSLLLTLFKTFFDNLGDWVTAARVDAEAIL
jgi:hypothetical protein